MPRLRVSISGDGLTAELHAGPGPPVKPDEVQAALRAQKVESGLDAGAIAEFTDKLADARFGGKVVVASGQAPRPGADGRLDGSFRQIRLPGTEHQDGHIDFRERDLLHSAVADTEVARVVAPTAGTPGRDVRGRVLAARPGRPHRQRLGQGVRLDGDKVIATRSGVIVCTETSFDVLPLHLHRGDVDMKSGNLHTRGSLQVQGDVREGFAATAEGDVDVTGAVFDAAVTAGGSVRIGQGLLGAACEVRAAQDVRCRHATSAQLHAGNEIEIADQATHCRMYATKVRAVRGRGTVVGGEVHCRESIEVRTAGTPNGAATLLCVGDLLAEEAELARITAELARLERAVRRPADPRGAMPRPTVPATDRLQQERLLLLGKQRELLHRANIRITDTVHPGVILRFGTVSLPIALPIHGATFHFDHEHEAIVQGRL